MGKRLFILGTFFYLYLSLFAINKADVANANLKTLEEMLTYALEFQGKPYCDNCEGPDGFDYSGFTKFLFKEIGFELPKDSELQAKYGKKVKKKKKIREGDLVFFRGAKKKKVECVGVVLKKKKGEAFDFIYVSPVKGVVIMSDESEEFKKKFMYGCRITTDKELKSLRKQYLKEQKVVEEVKKEAEEAREELEKVSKKAEKAKAKHEKAQAKQQKLMNSSN